MKQIKVLVEVTLKHPTDEVSEDDIAKALLAMEIDYNGTQYHRIWFWIDKVIK